MRILFLVLLTLLSCISSTAQAPPPRQAPATAADEPKQAAEAEKEVAKAQKQLEHGNTPAALEQLKQLAATTPPARGAHRVLGLAYYRTGKLVDAEQTFALAIAEDPADIESVQLRGLALYRLGQLAAAIPLLERVRQWIPDANADANYVLGLCYMNARRYDDARHTFAAQYGVPPDSGAAYLLIAQMLLHANLPELAAEDARQALELSPRLPLAHFVLGEVFLFKSDPVSALEQFEREREINPASALVYDRLGDVYNRTGKYQQAQEALTKAISLDQSSTGPFIQMGKVFLRRNDPETAAMYLKHAARMDPSNYITHTLLGQAYRSLGREEDAKQELDTAGKIHSSSELKLPVE